MDRGEVWCGGGAWWMDPLELLWSGVGVDDCSCCGLAILSIISVIMLILRALWNLLLYLTQHFIISRPISFLSHLPLHTSTSLPLNNFLQNFL